MSNYIQDDADQFQRYASRPVDNASGMNHRGAQPRVQSTAFVIVLACLSISMLQLPVVRYAIYACPILIFVLWLFDGGRLPSRTQLAITAPFIWLLILFVCYIPMSGIFAWKWTFFVCVYTSMFLFVDFSKGEMNLLPLNMVLVGMLAYSWVMGDSFAIDINALKKGLTESSIATESTFAFPFGLFACFWILKGRYLLGFINFVLALVSFKRIVLIAMAAFLLSLLIPKKIRNSWGYALCGVFLTTLVSVLCVEFAQGQFDELLTAVTGRSPNAFSMGRKELWEDVLGRVGFDYADFVVMGVGMDQILGAHLTNALWQPFHNDFLAIWLSYGAIAMIVFAGLVLVPRHPSARALATFILMIFSTDNVIIYQHVMIPYLFMISSVIQADIKEDAIA